MLWAAPRQAVGTAAGFLEGMAGGPSCGLDRLSETGDAPIDGVAGCPGASLQREAGPKSTIQEARESAEREHILRALEESKWNVSGAARALGMERTNLHKRIRALGLSRER